MFFSDCAQSEYNALVLEHLKKDTQYVESDKFITGSRLCRSDEYVSWNFLYGGILLALLIWKLKAKYSKHIVYVAFIIQYLDRVMSSDICYRDDAVLAEGVFESLTSFLRVVWASYGVYVKWAMYSVFRQLQVYGKLRVFFYFLSVVLTALLVVYVLDINVTYISNSASRGVTNRMDDNIIQVEENRNVFDDVRIHPITKGRKYPKIMNKFFRYPSEDVRMECQFRALWLSGASPVMEQVVWRRNGVYFPFTDRHNHQISVREETANEIIFGTPLKERGLSWYSVNATLDIQLLRESEFGSYTCHNAKHMYLTLIDFLSRSAKLLNLTEDTNKSEADANESSTDGRKDSSDQHQAVDRKRLFQDEFSQMGEFRLIKMTRRQEIIRAPVSSILEFTTRYWRLARKEDVEIDYSVNAQSYYNLCPGDPFHGCSKFLLLYWYFGHEIGGRFGIPPLQLFTIWKNPNFPAESNSLVHCLCQKAYGYHTVKYLRRYYNSTTKQQELIEILHPHTLVVVPREQEMLHLFKNRSQSSARPEREVCEKPPSACRSNQDSKTIRDFAENAVEYFQLVEHLTMGFLVGVVAFALHKSENFIAFLGRYIRRFTLEGSMGFLLTAVISFDGQQTIETPFDVFLSNSEAAIVVKLVHDYVLPVLEAAGLKVCLRDRDIPPNLPEVEGLANALLNSNRFILFLSTSYLEDASCRDLEARMIIDVATRRPCIANQVLVVKLDHCESPEGLRVFQVHDWTASNLSLEDHLLRLLKWLEPEEVRGTVRNKLDGFLLAFPLLVVIILGSLLIFVAAFVLAKV